MPFQKPIFWVPYQRPTILWHICEPNESESLYISSFRIEIFDAGLCNVLKINKELLLQLGLGNQGLKNLVGYLRMQHSSDK